MTDCLPPATTSCGRCGCIIFYTGDDCVLCPPASDILKDTASSLGVSSQSFCEVDVDMDDGRAIDASLIAVPSIRICDRQLNGLPDEASIRDALVRAMILQPCFSDDSNRTT
ncbi:MAG: hypothetical protein ACW99U_04585 [Candidatus Thorarchaeota archaeon]|jgi:hypothetical protein